MVQWKFKFEYKTFGRIISDEFKIRIFYHFLYIYFHQVFTSLFTKYSSFVCGWGLGNKTILIFYMFSMMLVMISTHIQKHICGLNLNSIQIYRLIKLLHKALQICKRNWSGFLSKQYTFHLAVVCIFRFCFEHMWAVSSFTNSSIWFYLRHN